MAVLSCCFIFGAGFSTCFAQNSSLGSFTYQGRLNDATGPASGLFDFQFSLYSASAGPGQIGTTISSSFLPVTNGLFTVSLAFPSVNSAFDGSDRWLEIAVKPGGVATNYAVLSPRQQITATPYAIRAGSAISAASAQSIVGPVPASQISGVLSPANLPPGSGGASPVVPGGIVMSDDPANAALASQGFARVPNAELALTPEQWTKANLPSSNAEFISKADSEISVNTGTELIVFRFGTIADGTSEVLMETLIFNPSTRQWRKGAAPPQGAVGLGATAVWTGSHAILWGGLQTLGQLPDNEGLLRTIYQFPNQTLLYSPVSNQWTTVSVPRPPRGRVDHSAVWTGSRMLIWGGYSIQFTNPPSGVITTVVPQNNGAAFDPVTRSWETMSTAGAPSYRYGAVVAWAGDRMIVQGGSRVPLIAWPGFLLSGSTNDMLRDGFSYDPTRDDWSPIRSDASAPTHAYAKAVWTGNELFIYGGKTPYAFPDSEETVVTIRDAYSYSPSGDTWTARGNPDAMSLAWGGRQDFTMIWTGSDVIAWGGWGYNRSTAHNYERTDGHAYSFTDSKWRAISSPSSVLERYLNPQAAWIGDRMVIFGAGKYVSVFIFDSRIDPDTRTATYSPTLDSWRSEANYFGPPPLNPVDPSVVWTGKEFIVWGGLDNGIASNRGQRFNPATGFWTELSTTNVPAARVRHSAVWTGTRMVVWGGDGGGNDPIYPAVVHASGGAYDPVTDTWTSLPSTPVDPNTGGIFARTGHKAVSTAYGMVLVGGSDGYNNQGQNFSRTIARLSPNLASWTLAAGTPPAVGRFGHCLGTDGNRQILLWGGQDQVDSDPIGNGTFLIDAATLSATEQDSADQPEPSRNPTVVWSGKEFIVWGGTGPSGNPLGGGSKFNPDPASLYWTPLSVGGPVLTTTHAGHTAAWSGTEMLIWGGTTNTFGTRYNPRNDAWTPMAVGPVTRTGGKSEWTGTNMLLYLPALPAPGAIPELWQYQPPVKTYLYLKL